MDSLDMQVKCVQQWDRLAPLASQWDQLAGACPFRGWSWLSNWWRYYGDMRSDLPSNGGLRPDRELYVLLVFDDLKPRNPSVSHNHGVGADSAVGERPGKQRLVAIVPCYLERTITRGRVLRLLGDGEVCVDHLSILLDLSRVDEHQVISALATYLENNEADWDLLEFFGLEASDTTMGRLFAKMAQRGCLVRNLAGPQRWSVSLPESWELFLARHSKSHRKQLRRLQSRVLETDRAVWHMAQSDRQLETGWECLVDLHQRRRRSLGQPGCFASPRFASFHRKVTACLLAEGKLQLSWLELDGEPVAAEYMVTGNAISYAYQGGLSPERIKESPGQLALICSIQQAIASGHRQFDFLRGDEPYKAHWRAEPHATLQVRVVPPRLGARWRYRSWSHMRQAGQWMRNLVVSG